MEWPFSLAFEPGLAAAALTPALPLCSIAHPRRDWITIGVPSADALAERVLHAVTVTNDYIANTHGRANMFATLFVGALDPTTGIVAYVNGGHEPPRIVQAGGGVRAMLPPTGPAVGMLPEIPFTVGHCTLQPGETLLVLTDGVTESRAPNGQLLGDDTTDALLVEPTTSADALLDRMSS